MKVNIFLDDIRTPKSNDWIIIRNYFDFIKAFEILTFDDIGIISLDHDLADYDIRGNEKTGYDIAKWLVERAMNRNENLPFIQVHSANTAGANNIIKYINGYLRSKGMKETCVKAIVELKRGAIL